VGVHVILPWLYVTALLGRSDLGLIGIVVTAAGLAGLVFAMVAAAHRPSWRLFSLLLPLLVTHAYLQVVGVWLIGDHHEAIAVGLYAFSFLAALSVAAYAGRANPLAVAGGAVFSLAYAFVAYQASLFIFWNGLR
jgi:hypothetical protein